MVRKSFPEIILSQTFPTIDLMRSSCLSCDFANGAMKKSPIDATTNSLPSELYCFPSLFISTDILNSLHPENGNRVNEKP